VVQAFFAFSCLSMYRMYVCITAVDGYVARKLNQMSDVGAWVMSN